MNPTQERIKYYTEWVKILWFTLIADIGGVASLALGPAWPWKGWVIVSGIVIGIGLLSMVAILHVEIERLLRTGGQSDA